MFKSFVRDFLYQMKTFGSMLSTPLLTSVGWNTRGPRFLLKLVRCRPSRCSMMTSRMHRQAEIFWTCHPESRCRWYQDDDDDDDDDDDGGSAASRKKVSNIFFRQPEDQMKIFGPNLWVNAYFLCYECWALDERPESRVFSLCFGRLGPTKRRIWRRAETCHPDARCSISGICQESSQPLFSCLFWFSFARKLSGVKGSGFLWYYFGNQTFRLNAKCINAQFLCCEPCMKNQGSQLLSWHTARFTPTRHSSMMLRRMQPKPRQRQAETFQTCHSSCRCRFQHQILPREFQTYIIYTIFDMISAINSSSTSVRWNNRRPRFFKARTLQAEQKQHDRQQDAQASWDILDMSSWLQMQMRCRCFWWWWSWCRICSISQEIVNLFFVYFHPFRSFRNDFDLKCSRVSSGKFHIRWKPSGQCYQLLFLQVLDETPRGPRFLLKLVRCRPSRRSMMRRQPEYQMKIFGPNLWVNAYFLCYECWALDERPESRVFSLCFGRLGPTKRRIWRRAETRHPDARCSISGICQESSQPLFSCLFWFSFAWKLSGVKGLGFLWYYFGNQNFRLNAKCINAQFLCCEPCMKNQGSQLLSWHTARFTPTRHSSMILRRMQPKPRQRQAETFQTCHSSCRCRFQHQILPREFQTYIIYMTIYDNRYSSNLSMCVHAWSFGNLFDLNKSRVSISDERLWVNAPKICKKIGTDWYFRWWCELIQHIAPGQVASDKKEENTDAAQAEASLHSRMSSYIEASEVIRQRKQWKRAGLLEYLEWNPWGLRSGDSKDPHSFNDWWIFWMGSLWMGSIQSNKIGKAAENSREQPSLQCSWSWRLAFYQWSATFGWLWLSMVLDQMACPQTWTSRSGTTHACAQQRFTATLSHGKAPLTGTSWQFHLFLKVVCILFLFNRHWVWTSCARLDMQDEKLWFQDSFKSFRQFGILQSYKVPGYTTSLCCEINWSKLIGLILVVFACRPFLEAKGSLMLSTCLGARCSWSSIGPQWGWRGSVWIRALAVCRTTSWQRMGGMCGSIISCKCGLAHSPCYLGYWLDD